MVLTVSSDSSRFATSMASTPSVGTGDVGLPLYVNRQGRSAFFAGIFIAIIAVAVLAWVNFQGRQATLTFSSGALGGLYHSIGVALSQSLLEKQTERINIDVRCHQMC